MSNDLKGNERSIPQQVCTWKYLPVALRSISTPMEDNLARLTHDTTGWYKVDLTTLLGRN